MLDGVVGCAEVDGDLLLRVLALKRRGEEEEEEVPCSQSMKEKNFVSDRVMMSRI